MYDDDNKDATNTNAGNSDDNGYKGGDTRDYTSENETNTQQTKNDEAREDMNEEDMNEEKNTNEDVNKDSADENSGTYYGGSNSGQSESYYNSGDDASGSYYSSSQNFGGYDNGGNDKKKNKKRPKTTNQGRRSRTPVVVVVVVCAVIVVAALGATIVTTYSNIRNSDGGDVLSNILTSDDTDDEDYDDIGSTNVSQSEGNQGSSGVVVTDVSDIVDATLPSVVAITSTTVVEDYSNYYNQFWDYYFGGDSGSGNGGTYEESAAGSGIIVDQTDTELLIVTNNHVIEEADSLEVQFFGQENDETVTAYTKGTDPNADVAVVAVKLKDIPKKVLSNIKKATLGDSDSVKVGEGVIAIGNALGYGQSVTTGIISAKDRKATISDVEMTLLQTDAPINGGNSGGALINSKGEVIGINIAKYYSQTDSSVEGMGLAIPISSVKSIISNLETKETREKLSEEEQGYLGIVGFTVSDEDSQQYGMPVGVYVYSVTKGSAAAKAGIEASDIITSFDDQSVETMEQLQNVMAYYKPGEKVKVTIAYLDGKSYTEKEVTVTLSDSSVTETEGDVSNSN